jgi:para-aminobenzoate synthetase component 1
MGKKLVTPFVKEVTYVDPEQVLLRLSNEHHLCFLDSSKQDEMLGRYSYIAFDPFLILESKNDMHDPFDALSLALERYKSVAVNHLPPFQGGAMGYFGYDLLHHLENVPRSVHDQIKAPDMLIGLYDCLIAFDHVKQKAWIISQGFPETDMLKRMARAKQRAQMLYQKAFEQPERKPISTWACPSVIESNMTKAEYCQRIARVIDHIRAGDIYQANIAQCFSSEWPDNIDPIDLYIALRTKNPAPFSAFIQTDQLAIASASPERFMRLQDRHVETRPIKGTRARGKTLIEDQAIAKALLCSEKDRAENTMIVDLMRNDLSRVCESGSVKVTTLCGLETYETVHHLVSVIEGTLSSDHNAITLLKAAFPGGSITGAPKIRAMEIIHDIEPFSRGVYCGNIGYIGFDGNMDTSIVIRTYTIINHRLYFQAGGGIVADSDPEDEYEETLTKAFALRKIVEGL